MLINFILILNFKIKIINELNYYYKITLQKHNINIISMIEIVEKRAYK